MEQIIELKKKKLILEERRVTAVETQVTLLKKIIETLEKNNRSSENDYSVDSVINMFE